MKMRMPLRRVDVIAVLDYGVGDPSVIYLKGVVMATAELFGGSGWIERLHRGGLKPT